MSGSAAVVLDGAAGVRARMCGRRSASRVMREVMGECGAAGFGVGQMG